MINILILKSKEYEVFGEHIIGNTKWRWILLIFGTYKVSQLHDPLEAHLIEKMECMNWP